MSISTSMSMQMQNKSYNSIIRMISLYKIPLQATSILEVLPMWLTCYHKKTIFIYQKMSLKQFKYAS